MMSPRTILAVHAAVRATPDLPLPGFTRWPPTRKAALVLAFQRRLLTLEQILEAYGVTPEELAHWAARVQRFGIDGLAVTKLQQVGR